MKNKNVFFILLVQIYWCPMPNTCWRHVTFGCPLASCTSYGALGHVPSWSLRNLAVSVCISEHDTLSTCCCIPSQSLTIIFMYRHLSDFCVISSVYLVSHSLLYLCIDIYLISAWFRKHAHSVTHAVYVPFWITIIILLTPSCTATV